MLAMILFLEMKDQAYTIIKLAPIETVADV